MGNNIIWNDENIDITEDPKVNEKKVRVFAAAFTVTHVVLYIFPCVAAGFFIHFFGVPD